MPMFQRYSPDKQFIAKIKKGSISVNTGDRVTVLAFVNHFTSCPLNELVKLKMLRTTESWTITLKCLSIGTPKTIAFPFVPNGKLMDFRCPNN